MDYSRTIYHVVLERQHPPNIPATFATTGSGIQYSPIASHPPISCTVR